MNEVTKDFENLIADMNYGTTNQQYSTDKKSNLLSFQISVLKFANKYCPGQIPTLLGKIVANKDLIPEHYGIDDNEYNNLQSVVENFKNAFPEMASQEISQDTALSR